MPSKYQVSPRSILRPRGALSSSNPFSIISFGVVSMVITLLGVITASLAVALALGAINSPSAFATDSASASTDVTLNLGSAMYIRVLDSTATSEISELSFDFTPTAAGVSSTKSAVVEVGTSNETGYTLYMESSYQNASSAYTTNLTNLDADISDYIPTSVPANPSSPASSAYPFWYYYNPYAPLVNGVATVVGNSVIPTHSNPDIIAKNSTAIDKVDTTVPFTIGVNSTIAAGTYANQLTFTAVGNALPVSYTLNYNANTDGAGGDDGSVSNLPSTQSERIVQGTYTFTIPSTAPTRSNYAFAGYSTDPATDPTSSTATIYQPGDTITLTSGSSYSVEETLYALWRRETSYTLEFNLAGGSAPTSDPDAFDDMTASEVAASHTFTIPSVVPEKSGYSFQYWTDSSSNQYNPGDTITVIGNEEYIGQETLTANWQENNFWTITTMQEMTAEICNSVYTPNNGTGDNITLVDNAYDYYTTYGVSGPGTRYVAQRTLYDIRGADGTGTSSNPVTSGSNAKTYTIRKLADGNCWMSENLALPLALNTPVEASYNDGSTFTYTPTNLACIGSSTRYGSGNYAQYYYYSWSAASAEVLGGSSPYPDDTNGSICPIGWRLPADYGTAGAPTWGELTIAYGVTTTGSATSTSTGYLILDATPISLVRVGNYFHSSLQSTDEGLYWNSTSHGASYRSGLQYYKGLVNPQVNYGDAPGSAGHGLSVRCVSSPLAH